MRVFPVDRPRATTSKAEVALYEALRAAQLDGWSAWHSLRLRSRDGWEGEGDFVLLVPGTGLVVLEVKGGRIELRGGHWLQNGRTLERTPRDQALHYVKGLIAALRERGADAPPYGAATAFPDVDFSLPPGNGDLAGLVLGRRDLAHLQRLLPELARQAIGAHHVAAASRLNAAAWRRTADVLTALWGETWVPTVRLRERLEDAALERVALDKEQLSLLDAFDENRRAVVAGGAGTGKSLLAVELCRRRASSGKRALYVCFTDALARSVGATLKATGAGATTHAAPIRQYACELVNRGAAGASAAPAPRPSSPEFWRHVSLQAACDALPPPEERPGVVVVDEAQDFEADDWQLVSELVGNGELWAFSDKAQAFWRRRTAEQPAALFAGAAQLKLTRQYRCPGGLWELAQLYADDGPTVSEPPRALPPPEVFKVVGGGATPESVQKRLAHELDRLRHDGARPEDIAVVSLAGQVRSHLFKKEKLGSHRLVRADAPDAGSAVVMETFLRFKGLERPLVIVVETSGEHITHYGVRMHIAMTRATVALAVVADAATLERDPLLRAAAARQ